MKPTVFIHTNEKQLLGAKVSEYSLRRNSAKSDEFDVRTILAEDQPELVERHGQTYLRKGRQFVWDNDDLQSFTPVRFLAPQLAHYQGRALVIDPDVFAVADVVELLSRDMQGKSIVCRRIVPEGKPAYYATSVMLLDCARLTHWRWQEQIQRLFDRQLDYSDWMNLSVEDPGSIGELEPGWNHFDTLDEETRLLHNTMRITQPWKTGLPVDFVKHAALGKLQLSPLQRVIRRLRGKPVPKSPPRVYQPHPDPRQEQLFFGLLGECLDAGIIDEAFVREEVARRHVRPDALARVDAARVRASAQRA